MRAACRGAWHAPHPPAGMPPTPAAAAAAAPLLALLVNSWVLAIMAGIVAIIVVAKGRIHVPEPLAHTHATNGVLPYVMPLDKTSM